MADPKREIALPPALFFNGMRVSHTPREVFFDLFQVSGDSRVGALVTRVVTTPAHAKAVLKVLTDNLKKYEAKYGEIVEESVAPEETVQ